ncbi:MAG: M28 family peptidase [Prevotella sp.]|nr:M28 family peptidase [Prevotella sp.]
MKAKKIFIYLAIAIVIVAIALLVACTLLRSAKPAAADTADDARLSRLVFNADSAFAYCARQCAFGPRTMNSAAHDACGEWIKSTFESFGLTVKSQRATLTGYDGTALRCENIGAFYRPELPRRILLCAHWDSRPWADNDPDAANHKTPILGANDGASGVAVLLELARMLAADSIGADVGVDFVCFDAEDYGTPQWADAPDDADTWALGAQYWSERYARAAADKRPEYEFGILLDMVGGEGARFFKEGISERFGSQIIKRVWSAARQAGYGSFFVGESGAYVSDDHVPVNEVAGVKCIDIIAHYPDCPQSSFGPTWHTVDDTMEHISPSTLKAVGQTLARLLAEY